MKPKIPLAALAAVLLASDPSVLPAQVKALVYCTSLEMAPCRNAASIVKNGAITVVDSVVWNEAGGTGTLQHNGSAPVTITAATDFTGYAVLVVPSFGNTNRFNGLRNAAIAAALHNALTGRVAGWSGAIDALAPAANNKTQLLRNLAGWARQGTGTGLVFLLETGSPTSNRYNWLNGIAGVSAGPDAACSRNFSVATSGSTFPITFATSDAGNAAKASLASTAEILGTCGFGTGPTVDATGPQGSGTQSLLITFRQVDKATTTVSAVGGSGTYGAASASVTATITAGAGGVSGKTITFSYGTDVATGVSDASGVANASIALSGRAAGSYPLTATFAEDATHLGSSGAGSVAVGKAPGSVVITGPSSIAFGTTGEVSTTSVVGDGTVSFAVTSGPCSISGTTVSMTSGTGTCTVQATLSEGANYTGASSNILSIGAAKASATISVTGGTFTYDAAAHGATGSATGIGGADLSAQLDLGASFTDVPGGTAHWTFSGGDDYNDASGSVAITIGKADASVTVTGYSGTFDGASHGATGSATGIGGADLSGSLDLGSSFTDVPGGTAHWTFSGGTNYEDEAGDVSITISKADADVSVAGYSGTFDGAAHGATGSATGIGGADLSGSLDLGSSFTDVPGGNAHWTFSGGTNYEDEAGDVAITISKADANVTVTGYSGTFDGASHGATGSATGIGGADLSGSLDLGASFTDVPGGTAHWTFSGGTNYEDEAGDVSITIAKADASVTVTGYSGTFDGAAHGATGSATGIGGADLSGSLDLGASFTDVPGGTAHWTFSGGTNYEDESGDVAITIAKADANVTVTGYSGTFDGASHGATGSATGIGGADLSGSLDLGSSFTDVPGGTAHWTFSGGTNYEDEAGDVAITIAKADASVTVTGYSGTFDGAAHGATGSATGIGGADLSGSLDLGSSFTDVPGGTAHWTFSGGTNYEDEAGDVAITIAKADASVTVTGYSGTFDGAAHGATGSATGIGGADLSGSLDLGASFTDVPGGTAHWTFSGGTNYEDEAGDVAITISKADASVTVTGYSGTFDGAAHGATGSATGIGGADLSGSLDLGSSFTDVPGGTAHWTFSGGTNYEDEAGDVAITIAKADASVTVTGYSGTFDGASHGATGSATGIGGADLSGSLDLGSSFTDVPGGTAHWTFSGGTNYEDEAGDVSITISKADASVTVTGYSGTFDGASHGATGSATGIGGADLSGSLDLGSSFTDVPGGNAHWTFSGGTNYEDESGDVAITIAKADASVTVTGYSGTYDGGAHGATGSATGIGGADLSGSLDLGASFTDVPGGTAHWTFSGGTNYEDEAGDVAITIAKADANVTVTGYSGTFDGASHGATGSATGIGGADLSGSLDLGASFTDVPGGTAHWTFSGGTNYEDEAGDVAITIAKADANVTVTGYSGTYDGGAHGATGSATGIGGADLSGSLDLGASFTDVPGGTAHWTFSGGTNYEDESGDVAITIAKANATISVTGYSGTYDGAAHGATGTATGIGGTDLISQLNLGASFTNVPGGTATWTFTGGTNYNDATGTVPIAIAQKALTVKADDKAKTYDGSAYSPFTSTVTGFVAGEGMSVVTGSVSYSGTAVGAVNQGGYTITPVVTGLSAQNYSFVPANGALTINRRPITVTADAKSKVFGAPDPPLTYQLTSGSLVAGDGFSGALVRPDAGTLAGEMVGAHPILQGTVTAGANYQITYLGASLVIGAWTGQGFYQPIGVPNSIFVPSVGGTAAIPAPTTNTVWNTAKGGSTIPLKFNVFAGSAEQITVAAVRSFTFTRLSNCTAGAADDPVEEVLANAGSTTLRYDGTAGSGGQFIQNWKTPSVSSESCYRVALTFQDGSALYTFVKLRK